MLEATGRQRSLVGDRSQVVLLGAITAQPGDSPAHGLEDWFWHKITAGEMLTRLRETCLDHEAKDVRDVGRYMVGEIEWQYCVKTR